MQIQRMGRSGQIYSYDIAGDAPTEQELQDFSNIVETKFNDSFNLGPAPEELSDLENLKNAFSSAIDQSQLTTARAGQEVANRLGLESIAEGFGNIVETNKEQLSNTLLKYSGTDDVDSAGDLLRYTGQLVAQNIPNLAISAAGSIAGRKLAPIGKIAKNISPKARGIISDVDTAIGSVATQFGVNMFGGALLNEDELVAQGVQKEVDVGAAALYGLGSAALEGLSDLFILGGAKILGKPLLTKVEFKPMGTVPGRFATGAVKGIAVESPTELGQAILNRMQLGQDLTSAEAQKEYFEAAVAGGLVGGSIRGTIDVATGKNPTKEKIDELTEDFEEDVQRTDVMAQNVAQYENENLEAEGLSVLDNEQLSVVEQDQILFDGEGIDRTRRGQALLNIDEELNTGFDAIPLSELSVPERKKIRDARRSAGRPPSDTITMEELREVAGLKVANREAKKQKPLTSKQAVSGNFLPPEKFRWSQYEKAVRFAIQKTRDNAGKVVKNANLSIKDIMKASNVKRDSALSIRKRMLSEGVLEEYAKNKYAATSSAGVQAQPLREAEQRLAQGQASVEAAEQKLKADEKKAEKLRLKSPDDYNNALIDIEATRSTIIEKRKTLDDLAKTIKGYRSKRKTGFRKAGPKLNTEAQNQSRTKMNEAAKVTDNFKNNVQDVADAVKKRLTQVGVLKDIGGVEVVPKILGPSSGVVQGTYDPNTKVLKVASAIHGIETDPDTLAAEIMGVADHELIHALYDLGLFTKEEWSVLTNAAKKRKFVKVNKDGTTTTRSYTFYERAKAYYSGAPESIIEEEAVAEMFRLWAAGRLNVAGKPRNLFQRILNFFKGLAQGLGDTGFTTPDSIFESIESGELASEKRRASAKEDEALQNMDKGVRYSKIGDIQKGLAVAKTKEDIDKLLTDDIIIEDAKRYADNIKYSILPVERFPHAQYLEDDRQRKLGAAIEKMIADVPDAYNFLIDGPYNFASERFFRDFYRLNRIVGRESGKLEALKDNGNFFETALIRFPAVAEGFDLRNYLQETRQYDDLIDLESSIDVFIEEAQAGIEAGVDARLFNEIMEGGTVPQLTDVKLDNAIAGFFNAFALGEYGTKPADATLGSVREWIKSEGAFVTARDIAAIRDAFRKATNDSFRDRARKDNNDTGFVAVYRGGELSERGVSSFTTDPTVLTKEGARKRGNPYMSWLQGGLIQKYYVRLIDIQGSMDAVVGEQNQDMPEAEVFIDGADVILVDSRTAEEQVQSRKDRVSFVLPETANEDGKLEVQEELFDQLENDNPDGADTRYSFIPRMEHIENAQQLGSLRRKLDGFVKSQVNGRYWYKNLAKTIMKLVGSDLEKARMMVAFLADTSANTGLQDNLKRGIRAYYRWAYGQDIQSEGLSSIEKLAGLAKGLEPQGPKINAFYKNMMKYIDPETYGDTQDITLDLWMLKAFGLSDKTVKKQGSKPLVPQREFMNAEIQRLADKHGLENEQVQAAIWVGIRGELLGLETDSRGEYPAQDYIDAMQDSLAQLSFETRPGLATNHFPETDPRNNPDIKIVELADLHSRLSQAVLGDNGGDAIAQGLDLISPDLFEAPGSFVEEGQMTVSPGTQLETYAPQAKGGPKNLDPNTRDLLDGYAMAVGILFKQNSVGWHRPYFKDSLSTKESNGALIDIGRTLTYEESELSTDIIIDVFGLTGGDAGGGVADRRGLRVINWFGEKGKTNAEFHRKMGEVASRLGDALGLEIIKVKQFKAESNLIENDWSVDKNGEGYLRELEGRRPDIQRRVKDIVTQLYPAVADAETDIAERYGWTANKEINTIYAGRPRESGVTSLAEDARVSKEDRELVKKLPKLSFVPGQTTVYDPNASPFALIENPADGSAVYGKFRDFTMQHKLIVLPNGNEFGAGTRYGAAHIEEKDRGARAKFIAENTEWDSYMDMLSALGRQLEKQERNYTRTVNYNRNQDPNKRIDEKDLISFDGVMYGQATMSEQEIIREGLDPNTIYRKPFGQSTRYPLESYRTHFLWGGKNGTKPIKNEEGIFLPQYVSLITRRVQFSDKQQRRMSEREPTLFNLGAKGTALQAYMTELPDNQRKIGELHIVETVFIQPFNKAKPAASRIMETQELLTSFKEGDIRLEDRSRGKKYSILPTNPVLSSQRDMPENVRVAKSVMQYGKSAETISNILSVPLKAIGISEDKTRQTVDSLIEKFQDEFLPVGQLVEELNKLGYDIPDAMDTYLQEEQYHNKTGNLLRLAEEQFQAPLLQAIKNLEPPKALVDGLLAITSPQGMGFFKTMRSLGKDNRVALVETYLYALHAKERNAHIRKIDESNTSGSGMTDTEADQIIAAFEGQPNILASVDAIAQQVQGIVTEVKRINVESGLEPDRDAEITYEGSQRRVPYPRYDNYIPLKGFAESLDLDPNDGADKVVIQRLRDKYGTRGQENITATGRNSYPSDIIPQLIMQHQRAIDRGERNKVGLSFVKLIDTTDEDGNQRPEGYQSVVRGVARVTKKSKTRKVLDKNGYVRSVPSNDRNDPDIMIVKDGGREIKIQFESMRVARAMKGATGFGSETTSFLTRSLGKINRFLSGVNTSYNPEFFITNFARDIQTGLTNINATEIEGIATDVSKALPSSLKGLINYIIKGDKNTEIAPYYDRFLANGGQSALNMMDGLEQSLDKMDSILDLKANKTTWKKLKNIGDAVIDSKFLKFIENSNSVVENTIRLATFKTLVDRGFSDARAAQAARNVTVNFSKGGQNKTFLNSWYLFYNASIQGSFALLQAAVRSKKVRKIYTGLLVAGFLQDQLLAAFSEDDEDGQKVYDKIPDYVLEHNYILPFGFGDRGYTSIPMPYGMNAFVNFGRSLSRYARGGYTEGEVFESGVMTAIDAFNPLGGTESFANFASPTVIDPFIDLLENEDFAQKPVYKEGSPFGTPQPASQLHWSTTSPFFKDFAQWLNEFTGGSPARPGFIDASPDALEFLFGYFTGGVGRFAERVGRFGVGIATDPAEIFSEEGMRSIPFVRRVFGSVSSREDTETYIEGREDINLAVADLKDAIARNDLERQRRIRDKYAAELRVQGAFKLVDNARNRLIRLLSEVRNNPRMSEEFREKRIKELTEDIQALTLRGNKILNQMESFK